MNTENNKTNKPHIIRLALADKLNLKDPNKNMALANLLHIGKMLNLYVIIINFKMSAPTWNDEFNLPDRSYSSDIQDYLECIIKKQHGTITNNPHAQIYVNKIKNRIAFKLSTCYKLELLSPETTKLLGCTKKD